MAKDEVVLDGELSLNAAVDGETQLDALREGLAGFAMLVESGIAQIIFNDDYTITFIMTDGREFTTGSIRGATGPQGPAGPPGIQGPAGARGEIGAQGPAGERGERGPAGDTGASGKDGADGISPTVSITAITGGHRITITDADGQHSADVMDGDDYVLAAQSQLLEGKRRKVIKDGRGVQERVCFVKDIQPEPETEPEE